MADIRQQPNNDNLDPKLETPAAPARLNAGATLEFHRGLIQLVQLALSISTSSDFIVTAVNNSLTAARLLLACARERSRERRTSCSAEGDVSGLARRRVRTFSDPPINSESVSVIKRSHQI